MSKDPIAHVTCGLAHVSHLVPGIVQGLRRASVAGVVGKDRVKQVPKPAIHKILAHLPVHGMAIVDLEESKIAKES